MLYRFSSLTKLLLLGFAVIAFLYACSKGGDSGGGTPPNPCTGVTISVTGTVTDADAASSNGSVAASASGGAASYTFSLNGGAFQGSGTFGSLAKGTYTITAKDSKGCTGSASFTVNEKNACASVTITLSATATNSDPCSASGVITATAGGSSGYTYSLNSGAFQASNVFNGVAVGNYTVNVKDAAGCTKSTTVSVNAVAAGPLFQAARSVIQTNCATAGCHSGGSAAGGISFSNDCNIVINKDRVKARAIDGNPSFMPPTGPLPQGDRDKITAWINAGGRFTD